MQNFDIPFTLEERITNGVVPSKIVQSQSTENAKADIRSNYQNAPLHVLSYLIHEGYADTALNMAKDLRLDGIIDRLEGAVLGYRTPKGQFSVDSPSNNVFDCDTMFEPEQLVERAAKNSGKLFLEDSPIFAHITEEEYTRLMYGVDSIKTRGEVRRYLLAGMPDKARDLISDVYPTLLDSNAFVYFKLTQMYLIEMIKRHWAELAEISDPKKSEKCERQFLDDATKFISERLSAPSILESRDFLIEVEKTITLLCYGQEFRKPKESRKPIPKVLQWLTSQKMRQEVADLVNKSILIHENGAPDEEPVVRFDTQMETLTRKKIQPNGLSKKRAKQDEKTELDEEDAQKKEQVQKTARQIEEMNDTETLLKKTPDAKLKRIVRLLFWGCQDFKSEDERHQYYIGKRDLSSMLQSIFHPYPAPVDDK
ncbi:hypothetical protein HII13_004001 [Brettanomyces bruxellensis]|uniref:DEBR0S1_19724g1_1 n=1 Tax=Dekkera bruxellensis TaxID=5007 RepID=A0A7D9CVF1_DEKBR|nr:hypothetical protein HII13_004001 [Brettanomyces bruxellensis]VUG16554.1 DEBR0S1_19724g1_1 [Brettanomyces bruxellensis]